MEGKPRGRIAPVHGRPPLGEARLRETPSDEVVAQLLDRGELWA